MPTQRRRIGFLPRTKVQDIIDDICNHNKLSQSKVTGILVEEALSSRGLLNTSIKKLSLDLNSDNSESLLTANKTLYNEVSNDKDNINLEDVSINDEVKMINDFIEYKFFKNMMNRNKISLK
tara:strand:+ start:177 stop:542 length:366 start_codon:yes stop_codon:yes gene_type:complete